MPNHPMNLHDLSTGSVVLDVWSTARPLADPESADGHVFRTVLDALEVRIDPLGAEQRIGQLMIRGTIETMQANAENLGQQAGRIATEGAALHAPHDYKREAVYGDIIESFGRHVATSDPQARLAAVMPALLVPMVSTMELAAQGKPIDVADDPAEAREAQIEKFRASINGGYGQRLQVMYVARPSVA